MLILGTLYYKAENTHKKVKHKMKCGIELKISSSPPQAVTFLSI